MPTNFDDDYEPRLWRCDECRRVLGVVMRDTSKVRRLWVFTLDRCDNDVPPTVVLRNPPKGLFKVHALDSGKIECTRCGALNDWSMSKESYLKLINYYQRGDA